MLWPVGLAALLWLGVVVELWGSHRRRQGWGGAGGAVGTAREGDALGRVVGLRGAIGVEALVQGVLVSVPTQGKGTEKAGMTGECMNLCTHSNPTAPALLEETGVHCRFGTGDGAAGAVVGFMYRAGISSLLLDTGQVLPFATV